MGTFFEDIQMRLDKYLKESRLVKRRTVANELCDAGRVMINGKPARASKDVEIGDIIEIQSGERIIKAEVTGTDKPKTQEESKEMCRVIE